MNYKEVEHVLDLAHSLAEQKRSGLKFIIKDNCFSSGLQTVHTPYELCRDILLKLKEFSELKEQDILVIFNLEFIVTLIEVFRVPPKNITFAADSEYEIELAKKYGITNFIDISIDEKTETIITKLKKLTKKQQEMYNQIVEASGGKTDTADNYFSNKITKVTKTISTKGKDIMVEIKKKFKKQFDVCVMNPPYQAPTENKGAGHSLWDKFVNLAFEVVNENGYIAAIHPAGWRRPTGEFLSVGKKLRNKQMEYLEIYSMAEGIKTFGVTTRFDWYILKNIKNNHKTVVKTEDKELVEVDLVNLPCIPNGKIDKVINLLHFGKNPIELINDRSNYGADKTHISKEKTEKNKYPCVYSLPQKGIQIRWSSTNKNGHFGIPKVIFSNGASPQIIIDEKGEFGLTQWAFGIVDSVENLPMIKKAMESKEFVGLCKYMRFTLDKYDANFISCLRKDFWREFI